MHTHTHTNKQTHAHTYHAQVPVGHPDEIEKFDIMSYSKGACVIRMLYDWVGDEVRSILEYAGVY